MAAVSILRLVLLAAWYSAMIALSDRRTYIIHMDETKVMELKNSNKHPHKWYESILESVTKLGAETDQDQDALTPEILYTYENAMTGFAAKLTTRQFEALSMIDGFLFGNLDGIRTPHTTYSPRFLGLDWGKGLWNGSHLGSDVIIGVVDTGIWPEHPSFHDSGLSRVPSRWKGTCEKGFNFSSSNCNKKLIGARFYLKGYEATYGRIDDTYKFRSARDSGSHGTHTASTAAGNVVPDANLFGLARGVAHGISYASRIAAYKVCWRQGCTNSDVAAAIDQSIADGVDILSLSLVGDPIPYYQDPPLIAALGASRKGIFVSFAAGNDGPTPSTVCNTVPWVATVGASSLDRTFAGQVTLSNGIILKGASIYSGRRTKTKQLPLVYKETAGGTGAEFCTHGSLSSELVKDKIVLCQRGINYRTQKGSVVKSAGGAAMLLLNSPEWGEELIADAHVLPASFLRALDSEAIQGFLISNKSLTASISFLGTQYGARAPVIASMSSRGPNSVDPYVIKPDIVAPGIDILAAWSPIASLTDLNSDKRRADFNIVSGTSMSCPHVSGVAALIKSVHSDWSPAAIKSAIMTSAHSHDNKGHLISDASVFKGNKLATPFGLGAGHVNPERALDPGLVYDILPEDYLDYLCSINYTDAQVAVFAGRKYKCPSGVYQPGDLNYPSFAVIFAAGKTEKTTVTYRRTLTNVGKGKVRYRVFFEEPKGVDVVVEPTVLYFKSPREKLTYNVSFSEAGTTICRKGASVFGSLTWVAGKYSVRSPIAVTWL
ncbi:subtilisin-like protease SBT1.1 [Silene latifolia]|uniref:subtilisin-like protease SBT1.1 n=1 Tax=Silene latifolia TaxID=37657 RepID=UPI003D7811D0